MQIEGLDKRPLIKCGHCKGWGWVALPEQLWNTLRCLDAETAKTTPEIINDLAIYDNDYVTIPALCNRLKVLEQIGCAIKHKSKAPTGGCWYLWRRTQESK